MKILNCDKSVTCIFFVLYFPSKLLLVRFPTQSKFVFHSFYGMCYYMYHLDPKLLGSQAITWIPNYLDPKLFNHLDPTLQ